MHASPGKVVTRDELEALGIVAAEEKAPATPIPGVRGRAAGRSWPNYRRCIENAPEAREGGRPDISRADYTFCLLAIDWGWSVEEVVGRLMQESEKAKENGPGYAERTARAAAKVVEGRGGRRR